MYYELTDAIVVKTDLQATWAFFCRAENLPDITPPWMNFKVLADGPIHIGQDTHIDYQIRWAGMPLRWRTRIIDWSPPRQFIDLQLSGPYDLWHHQHTFEQVEDGTLCRDRVLYRVPLGPLGRIANAVMVRRQLIEIFEYRRKAITERLGWVRAVQAKVEIRKV